MSDVMSREMYKEHILDLFKHPHNFGELDGCTHKYDGHNPLCGDEVTLLLRIEKGVVVEVKFKGKGCAISIASASLLTDKVKGMTVENINGLCKDEILEMLMIPIGPVRLKCALLCLETLHEAVREENGNT